MKTPNQLVADEIVAKLGADNVLLAESMTNLSAELSTGKVSNAAWITLVGVDGSNRKKNEQDKTQKH